MSKGHVSGKVRKNGAYLKDTLFMNRQMPGAYETAFIDSNTLQFHCQMPGEDETACIDLYLIGSITKCPGQMKLHALTPTTSVPLTNARRAWGCVGRYMEAFRADMCLVIGQKEISVRRTPCSRQPLVIK